MSREIRGAVGRPLDYLVGWLFRPYVNISRAAQFLAVTGAIPVGSVWATMGQIQGYDFPAETREKAFALGERLVKAWSAKEITPEYQKIHPQFEERMRSPILWRKQEWPYEYEYWKACRGLNA